MLKATAAENNILYIFIVLPFRLFPRIHIIIPPFSGHIIIDSGIFVQNLHAFIHGNGVIVRKFVDIDLGHQRIFSREQKTHRHIVAQIQTLYGIAPAIKLPEGLQESSKLPEPIYTPSTKAELGDHDENITFEQSIDVLEKIYPGKGEYYAAKIKDYTIELYKKCEEYALSKGIIIADTKFEFGLDENGEVVLGDEMLTPDSSRFWPVEGYEPGKGQPSFDKQFVRDWLKANPDNDFLLPDEVVEKTVGKYKEAYELLTGTAFER